MKTEKKFSLRNSGWALLLMLLACSSTQTAEKIPLPEYYGTYVVSGGKLVSLDRGPGQPPEVRVRIAKSMSYFDACDKGVVVAPVADASVFVLSADAQLLVFFQPSGPDSPMTKAQELKLGAFGYARNIQVEGCGNSSAPVRGVVNAWGYHLESVPMNVKPVPGQQEMALAVPKSRLEPGLYSFSGGVFRTGVWFVVTPLSQAERAKCTDVTEHFNRYTPPVGTVHTTRIPCGTSSSASSEQPLTPEQPAIPLDARHLAEQLKKEIASYETPSFHSPLDDKQLLQSIISESQASGVSLWLLFGQAKFETTFGDPINATVRDGMTFTDGSTGNAHNVFNIRPGTSWVGKVLDTGRGGKFRVYASYEDSVRDYLLLMSSNLYKGKSLDSLINTYFPPGENGPARVEEYIASVIQIAGRLGFTADKNTIPIP